MTFKKFHLLSTYLQQETALEIRLVVPKDSAEFEKSIKSGDNYFAFQDTYTYVRFADLYNRDHLLLESWPVATRLDAGEADG